MLPAFKADRPNPHACVGRAGISGRLPRFHGMRLSAQMAQRLDPLCRFRGISVGISGSLSSSGPVRQCFNIVCGMESFRHAGHSGQTGWESPDSADLHTLIRILRWTRPN